MAFSNGTKLRVNELAREVYKQNKTMNAAKRAHDKARKELFGLMFEGHVDVHKVPANGGSPALTASVVTPEVTFVDVHKLRQLVDEETFMKVVSATQTTVAKHVGTDLVHAVCETRDGRANVTVKA